MRAISVHAFVIVLGVAEALAIAEYRTWSAATGGFKTEAELIEVQGTNVRLRLKNGSERSVPLDKLSAEDQRYAQQHASKPAGAKNARLEKLERNASRCQSAEARLLLYKVFCQDPETTDEDRQAVTDQMLELRELAEKHMVWMRGAWTSTEQFERVRNQANSLMRQGLELLRLKQEDGFRRKFADAAALEPDTIRADFLTGMLYAVVSSDYLKSKQAFEKCAEREPDNVAVLNNLALVELKRGAAPHALAYWQKAIEIEPNQHVVQNLGRLLEQTGEKKITASKRSTDVASEMYTGLLSLEKFAPTSAKHGWIYMLLDEDLLSLARTDSDKKKEEPPAHLPPPASDGSVVIGGGTGFVVFPHYILTNNHVIDQGTSFEVQTGDSAQTVRLPARLVARSIKPDLALLYCEDLKAAPLAIDPATCGRGTDIMTLGYPEMFVLGASLKATRGVISAVPSSAIDDMYLYDAVVNHGNSGGPVCNRFGNVVAVTTIMVSTAGKYGGGIPGAAALAFVRQHVPGFHDAPRGASAMEWPAVDQVASPSTLLIWTRSQTPATSRPVVSTGIFEDRSCSECDGHGTVPCQCSVSGGARRRPVSAGVCRVCQGKKVVPCRVCNGKGIDPVFQPKEVTPKQPTPSAPPPRNGSTTINTQLDANLAASIAAAAREGRLQATKLLGAEKEGKQFGVSPADGGILVGLDPRRGPDGHVVGIRPVFQTARGLQMGQWHGSPPVSGELPHRILLRPGYAVAGLRIPQGESLDDLTVVLMRIDGDHLNPAERVEFRVTSAPPVGPFEEIGMTGSFFVGIVGKTATSPDNALLGLGLLSIKP